MISTRCPFLYTWWLHQWRNYKYKADTRYKITQYLHAITEAYITDKMTNSPRWYGSQQLYHLGIFY